MAVMVFQATEWGEAVSSAPRFGTVGLELHARYSHVIGGSRRDRDRGTRDGDAAGGSGDGNRRRRREVLSVSSVSRKGTNARHWSLEQLRMWRAWVRR